MSSSSQSFPSYPGSSPGFVVANEGFPELSRVRIRRGLLSLHSADLSRLQRLLDPLLVAALFLMVDGAPIAAAPGLLIPGWILVAGLTTVLLPQFGLYGSYRQKSLLSLARNVLSGWCAVLMGLLLVAFLSKSSATFSRLDTSFWALGSLGLLMVNHVGTRKLLRHLRRQGGNTRNVLYWGTAEHAARFASQLRQADWLGLRCVAWFSPSPPVPEAMPQFLPRCSGGLAEMRRWLDSHHVDQIVFSHVPDQGPSMQQLLACFGDTSLPVVYAPPWAQSCMRLTPQLIGNQIGLELWGGEPSLIDAQLKRLFDLVMSVLGVVLISPVLLLIAIAVACTSPGPILFLQQRYGLDGRCFQIYKFRTMRVMEAGNTSGLRQASRDDPRVTPLGRVLRRWSLDELPQLINVIRGEMSLVGPRPHAVEHNEQYRRLISGYMQRHGSKPGLTGLAQVEGFRGETATLEAMAKRVEADLRYRRDWSLLLDLKILLASLFRLRSPQAY